MYEYCITAGEGTLVKHGVLISDHDCEIMAYGLAVSDCGMDLMVCPVDDDCHTGLLPSEVK